MPRIETRPGSVASEKMVELAAYDFVMLLSIFNFFDLIPRPGFVSSRSVPACLR